MLRRRAILRVLDGRGRPAIERQSPGSGKRGGNRPRVAQEFQRVAASTTAARSLHRFAHRDRAPGVQSMLRHTIRALLPAPVFAFAAIATLAIAIGATTAIFSVVEGVLLKPLPFPQSDRLVAVRHVFPSLDDDEHDASPAFYFTYRDNNTTFESVALWLSNTATVTGAGEPEEVLAVRASVEFLPTLRVEPLLGRRFTAADDTPGNPPTVMLSHGYWQRHFGGARDVEVSLPVDVRRRACRDRRRTAARIQV